MPCLPFHSSTDVHEHSCKERSIPVADQRPRSCPHCGCSRSQNGPHVLLGHGSYTRQLRMGEGECISVRVQRFLCTSCQKTSSRLPSEIVPRRRYAGPVIFKALVDHLIHGQSSGAVKAQASPTGRPPAGWKTLLRWKREALVGFWSSWAAQIGLSRPEEPGALGDGSGRLTRLLGLFGASSESSPWQLHEIARSLTAGWRTLDTRLMELEFVRTGRAPGIGPALASYAHADPTRNVQDRAVGAYRQHPLETYQLACSAVGDRSGLYYTKQALDEQRVLAVRAKPSP